jgi:uncharacterized protein DUF4328
VSDRVNPFQSPLTDSHPESEVWAAGGKPIIPFESGHTRAVFAMTLLALCLVADLMGAGAGLLEARLLQRIQAGEAVDDATIEASDIQLMLVGFSQMGLLLLSGIAFLMWFHRSHRNLPALRARILKYSPRWAVGGFFIPIMNLYRPYQVMQEVWTESDPFSVKGADDLTGRPVSGALVGWWWALWIIGGILGQAAFRVSMRAESVEMYLVSSWLTVSCDLVSVLDAVLIITLVRRIDANQLKRHQLLSGSPANDPFQGLS